MWARTPLVLALSDDGVVFDRHYIVGGEPGVPPRRPAHGKGGRYGYPFLEVADGDAWVVYSVNKEDIAVCRLTLEQLA
jgi:hypothetical protein